MFAYQDTALVTLQSSERFGIKLRFSKESRPFYHFATVAAVCHIFLACSRCTHLESDQTKLTCVFPLLRGIVMMVIKRVN